MSFSTSCRVGLFAFLFLCTFDFILGGSSGGGNGDGFLHRSSTEKSGNPIDFESKKAGDGVTFAKRGMVASVFYTGTLSNGKVFDTTDDEDGSEPIDFVVGRGEMVKCWDEVFPRMSVGEKATISCSPAMAYGEKGAIPQGIPPNAHLTYQVELVDVKEEDIGSSTVDPKLLGNDENNMFAGLDVNKDGSLDATEMNHDHMRAKVLMGYKPKPSPRDTFIMADTNGDGAVTYDEYLAFVWRETHNATVRGYFAKFDRNKDGSWTLDEYSVSPHAFQSAGSKAVADAKKTKKAMDYSPYFNHVDTDKDGKLSAEEYFASDKDWLSKCDTNKDGLASHDEWVHFGKTNHVKDSNEDTFTEEVFTTVDANKDGYVSPVEYHQGMEKMAMDLLAKGYGGMGKGDL